MKEKKTELKHERGRGGLKKERKEMLKGEERFLKEWWELRGGVKIGTMNQTGPVLISRGSASQTGGM